MLWLGLLMFFAYTFFLVPMAADKIVEEYPWATSWIVILHLVLAGAWIVLLFDLQGR